jgi:hypothetical protein
MSRTSIYVSGDLVAAMRMERREGKQQAPASANA